MSNYELDLYTLSPRFLIRHKVERYSSLIWTERYSSAGDVELVMPPTRFWMDVLVPGCLLGLRGRREIMKVQNQSFENGLMTITGTSLLGYLNHRISWFKNPDYDPPDETDLVADYETDDQTAGEFLADVIDKLFVNPPPFTGDYAKAAFDQDNDHFGHLTIGHIDHRGDQKELSFPNAQPVYDALTQIAAQEHVGISMYLAWANFRTRNYALRFITYRGKDRTSGQLDRDVVRFSPKLESFIEPKELRSNVNYKNVCYVNYKGDVSVHYPEHVHSPPAGFRRRVTYVDISDKKIKAAKLPAARRRAARKEFRAHRHTHSVDGQIIQNLSDYKFGTDYHLGDIVEVEGNAGMIVRARVAEYVRSQDQYGPKNYPTLEILAEDETNYHSDPTFEPNVSDPVYPPSPPAMAVTPMMPIDGPIDVGPVEAPVFEDPDLDPELDPQEQVPDLLDPIQEESPFISAQALSALTDWEVSDWEYDTNRGFYVHSGNVYVIGSVAAISGGPQGSDTLLQNIPQEYAPETPVNGRVLIDHVNSTYEYACDSGLKIGPWLPVTIDIDGTVTLDGGNPFRPPTNSDDFSYLSIILSTLSWPTSAEVYDAYDSDHSLDDWIGSAANINAEFGGLAPEDIWQNIDGTYSLHDERLHLNGKVKVVGDWAGYPYDALVGIPPEYQPQSSSEAVVSDWCEVISFDGYRFHIAKAGGGHNTALYSESGAQNPAAVDNKGCGYYAPFFYERLSEGFLTRGEDVTLDFVPASADSGVSYSGCKGAPVGDLPDIADWRGTYYNLTLRFTLQDILNGLGPVPFTGTGGPVDYTLVHGAGQHAFIFGMHPEMAAGESYYKVVFSYDSALGDLYIHLILEKCGGTSRAPLAYRIFHPGVSTSTVIGYSFYLGLSPDPSVVGFTGTPVSGWNYYDLQPGNGAVHYRGSDYKASPLGGGSPLAPALSKGDMGFHIPSGSSAQVLMADITGLGSFPHWAPGDVVDLTNCGWPLY